MHVLAVDNGFLLLNHSGDGTSVSWKKDFREGRRGPSWTLAVSLALALVLQ